MIKVRMTITIRGDIELNPDGYMEGTSKAQMLEDAIESAKAEAAKSDPGFEILAIRGEFVE